MYVETIGIIFLKSILTINPDLYIISNSLEYFSGWANFTYGVLCGVRAEKCLCIFNNYI